MLGVIALAAYFTVVPVMCFVKLVNRRTVFVKIYVIVTKFWNDYVCFCNLNGCSRVIKAHIANGTSIVRYAYAFGATSSFYFVYFFNATFVSANPLTVKAFLAVG